MKRKPQKHNVSKRTKDDIIFTEALRDFLNKAPFSGVEPEQKLRIYEEVQVINSGGMLVINGRVMPNNSRFGGGY